MGPHRSNLGLPDTFQTPSRHLPHMFQTPTNKGQQYTFNPPSRHPTSTFQTPSIHNLDNIQTLPNIFQGQMGSNRSNLGLPDTFHTHFRHFPDTMKNLRFATLILRFATHYCLFHSLSPLYMIAWTAGRLPWWKIIWAQVLPEFQVSPAYLYRAK